VEYLNPDTPEERLKLLVVDDEPDNLDLLYRTFRRDFEVIQADSAITALQILEEQGEMGIIISDQRMPEMLGSEFLSKTVEKFPDTIRIVLTGYTDVEDLVDAINSGQVFKYITKPWTAAQLRVVVQQAAETYKVIKQRTNDLRRALRRESLFNEISTDIRGSLNYESILENLAQILGKTFQATCCRLYPVSTALTLEHPGQPQLLEPFSYFQAESYTSPPGEETVNAEGEELASKALHYATMQIGSDGSGRPCRLAIPLCYQAETLAILALDPPRSAHAWSTEDVELLQSVADQAALAISQAKLYQRTQEQAEQMRAELAVARQIQTNLLRQNWCDIDGVKVQACCYPAREVGGDFFEVFYHPQGDIWLAVGDVSGKGVPAALFMASALSVLRRELGQEVSPEPNIVMGNLNEGLSENLIGANCFITMVVARYTPTTGRLTYANAGHIYPLIWSQGTGGADPLYLKTRGIPLGILPTWKADAGNITLNARDVLLLTSDGITEATVTTEGPSGTPSSSGMLQQSGLWNLLQTEARPLDLTDFLARIRSKYIVQEDDQTILSLEVL
jgi:serine phosphatase RsbU (regulator of sigma subunit)/CheY-like chemotaxis protein